jgi:hypothetical protein
MALSVATVLGLVAVVGAQGYLAAGHSPGAGAALALLVTVGQVTLLDGSTGDVAARAKVAPAGHQLLVAQSVRTCHRDQTAGSVVRVVGATQRRAAPPGGDSAVDRRRRRVVGVRRLRPAYVVDATRGNRRLVDPVTLQAAGRAVSVAASLNPSAVTMTPTAGCGPSTR